MREVIEKLFDAVSTGKISTEEWKIASEAIRKAYDNN